MVVLHSVVVAMYHPYHVHCSGCAASLSHELSHGYSPLSSCHRYVRARVCALSIEPST